MLRTSAFIMSILFHSAVILGGIFWNGYSSAPVKLTIPVYQVDLVTLKAPAPKPARQVKAAVKTEAKAAAAKKAEPAKPKPKPAPKPKAVKTAKPKAKTISSKKTASKVRKPKKTATKTVKKKARPKPSRKQVLKGALASVQKSVAKEKKAEKQTLSKELAALKEAVGDQDVTGVEGGEGTAVASSLYQIYGMQIIQTVQDNWRYADIGGNQDLAATVIISLEPDGTIKEIKLAKGSGRPEFDASVLRAVKETEVLPPPPNKDLQLLEINFNLKELNQ